MSKRTKILYGLAFVTGVALIVCLFIWQYMNALPREYANSNTAHWYFGLMHGYFAVANFMLHFTFPSENAAIAQAGADRWYQFWFLIGVGAFSSPIRGAKLAYHHITRAVSWFFTEP